MKKVQKKEKVEKKPLIKTKVKYDNSIEVEMKNPSNTILGKVFIYLLVIGMTVLSLVGLIVLIIRAMSGQG